MSLIYDLEEPCPDCAESPTGICTACKSDLADSEAERWADGRRDGDD